MEPTFTLELLLPLHHPLVEIPTRLVQCVARHWPCVLIGDGRVDLQRVVSELLMLELIDPDVWVERALPLQAQVRQLLFPLHSPLRVIEQRFESVWVLPKWLLKQPTSLQIAQTLLSPLTTDP